MKALSTCKLDSVLMDVKTPLDKKKYVENAITGNKCYTSFHQFFNDYIAYKDINITDVLNKSGINKNYVYGIVNGTKKNPGRDKVIALCVAAGMDFVETNRTLKISKLGPLYSKDPRDVTIIVFINNKNTNVTDLNLQLTNENFKPLDI
ncbi:MAG: hypothetical protein RSB99_03810 [Bacilli bacterium]